MRKKHVPDMDYLMDLKAKKASQPDNLSKPDKQDKSIKQDMIRKTFIIKPEYHDKIKALAYWERKEITEVVDGIFGSYFEGKAVKPIPEKR